MTDPALLTALRHNTWANIEVLRFCAALTPEQLAWTAPGTFGSIHATLQHIVGAEQGYLFTLTGGELPPAGPLPTEGLVPLDELRSRAVTSAERLERLLGSDFDATKHFRLRRGGTATGGVLVSQYLHHGSDHRAHVGTILGARGLAGPNCDVWAYGSERGDVTPNPA
jgi:uncharacterized damage-inducible protein DinB